MTRHAVYRTVAELMPFRVRFGSDISSCKQNADGVTRDLNVAENTVELVSIEIYSILECQ